MDNAMRIDPASQNQGPIEAKVPAAPKAGAQSLADAQQRPPPQELHAAVAALNRYLQEKSSSLQFSIDRSTGKTVVRVVDADTQELIRQIPSEEALAIARALTSQTGVLLKGVA